MNFTLCHALWRDIILSRLSIGTGRVIFRLTDYAPWILSIALSFREIADLSWFNFTLSFSMIVIKRKHCKMPYFWSSQISLHWRIQRGAGGRNPPPPPFIRKICQNGVEITHVESGYPLWRPKIIVEPPLENLIVEQPPLWKISGSATALSSMYVCHHAIQNCQQ
jgi:hypothetical protein